VEVTFTIYRWEIMFLTTVMLVGFFSAVKVSPGLITIKYENANMQNFQRSTDKIKIAALTFDDGPYPGYTDELLEILRKENVKATFFFTGKMCELHRDLVLKTYKEGHEIGNHTYSHVNLTKLSTEKMQYEIEFTSRLLSQIIGKPISIFRPPGGNYNKKVVDFIKEHNYIMVLWTLSPGDYNFTSEKVIYNRVVKNLTGEDVVLLHSGVKATCKALPQIIKTLKRKGYKFVTISEYVSLLSRSRNKTWGNYLFNAEKIYKKSA